jgi:hypothetical protein
LKIIVTVSREKSVEAWLEMTVPAGVVHIGGAERRVLIG